MTIVISLPAWYGGEHRLITGDTWAVCELLTDIADEIPNGAVVWMRSPIGGGPVEALFPKGRRRVERRT